MGTLSWGEWLIRTAPAWLVRSAADARVVLEAIGEALDGAREALMAARRARFVALAPASLLERHGQIRRLRRYPGESAEVYRERLRVALPLYRQAGRRSAILRVLRALGWPDATVDELYRLGTPRHDGTYFHNGEIRHNGGTRRFEYDVHLPTTITGRVLSAELLTLVRSECQRWAPAWARLAAIVLDLTVETDAVSLPADTAVTVTLRRFRLHDGSWLHDGSLTHSPTSTTEVTTS